MTAISVSWRLWFMPSPPILRVRVPRFRRWGAPAPEDLLLDAERVGRRLVPGPDDLGPDRLDALPDQCRVFGVRDVRQAQDRWSLPELRKQHVDARPPLEPDLGLAGLERGVREVDGDHAVN